MKFGQKIQTLCRRHMWELTLPPRPAPSIWPSRLHCIWRTRVGPGLPAWRNNMKTLLRRTVTRILSSDLEDTVIYFVMYNLFLGKPLSIKFKTNSFDKLCGVNLHFYPKIEIYSYIYVLLLIFYIRKKLLRYFGVQTDERQRTEPRRWGLGE